MYIKINTHSEKVCALCIYPMQPKVCPACPDFWSETLQELVAICPRAIVVACRGDTVMRVQDARGLGARRRSLGGQQQHQAEPLGYARKGLRQQRARQCSSDIHQRLTRTDRAPVASSSQRVRLETLK